MLKFESPFLQKSNVKQAVRLSSIAVALITFIYGGSYLIARKTMDNQFSIIVQTISDKNKQELALALDQIDALVANGEKLKKQVNSLNEQLNRIDSVETTLTNHNQRLDIIEQYKTTTDDTLRGLKSKQTDIENRNNQQQLAIEDLYSIVSELESKFDSKQSSSSAKLDFGPSTKQTKSNNLKYYKFLGFGKWGKEDILILSRNGKVYRLRKGNTITDVDEWTVTKISTKSATLKSNTSTLTLSDRT